MDNRQRAHYELESIRERVAAALALLWADRYREVQVVINRIQGHVSEARCRAAAPEKRSGEEKSTHEQCKALNNHASDPF